MGGISELGNLFLAAFRKTNPNYNLTFRDYLAEWTALVERDINHPSIIAWTPLNETCGYHDLEEHRRIIADVYDLTHTLDSTRPVNDTSGYIHVKTDLWTVHTYHQTDEELSSALNQSPVFMHYPEVEAEAYHGQPYLMDEYGGVGFIPETASPMPTTPGGTTKRRSHRGRRKSVLRNLPDASSKSESGRLLLHATDRHRAGAERHLQL